MFYLYFSKMQNLNATVRAQIGVDLSVDRLLLSARRLQNFKKALTFCRKFDSMIVISVRRCKVAANSKY